MVDYVGIFPCFFILFVLHFYFVFFSSSNFERDIARILKEQEIVTKKLKEFEEGFTASKSPTEAKVGFAAVQEMARLQEQDGAGCDLSFLRFNPQSNRMTLEKSSDQTAKFPLEIPTPVQSPQTKLKRIGSFRCFFVYVLVAPPISRFWN